MVYTLIPIFLVMDSDVETTAKNDKMAYKGFNCDHSETFFLFFNFYKEVAYQNAWHTRLRQYFDMWIVHTPK
jgi:hypothetical protein